MMLLLQENMYVGRTHIYFLIRNRNKRYVLRTFIVDFRNSFSVPCFQIYVQKDFESLPLQNWSRKVFTVSSFPISTDLTGLFG